jgi:hypothetical protein
MADPANYLGEVMVHKPSRRIGPIVRAARSLPGQGIELILKTHDGVSVKGEPSEFELAGKEEYHSFVDGWLSGLPVAMY